MSDGQAFTDTSGEVSAIVGAPDAGAPRSARASVSAQHAMPEIPDDAIDETIIARRRQTQWSLVLPTGEPVVLRAEVVILGRRPSADSDYPGAQLVAIEDGTVSKTHARLVLRDDKWWVTDLDSTNGVLFATVLGTEVEATSGVEAEAGDRFLLGDAEVRLVRSDA
jgi:pSer/pThr/pTyr-binding forkhead associated (FHA) protein